MTSGNILLYLFIFSSLQIFAQNETEFMGIIKLNDSAMIPYEVNFKIINGKVKGFSLTDLGGAHETKSKLSGTYDPFKKEIMFNEYDIIYTKSDVSQNDFCFVYLEPTRYKVDKTTHFSGGFKGLFSDGQECISGEIYLNSVENIEKRVEKVTRLIERSNKLDDSIKEKAKNLKILDKNKTNVLLKSQVTSVFSKADKVILKIFDGGQEDGDIISIDINNKRLLSNYKVTKTPYLLEVPLSTNKTIIKITAISAGTISTNTAMVDISDGENEIRAVTNLNRGEETFLHFLKK